MKSSTVITRQRRVFLSTCSAFVRISSNGIACSSAACSCQSRKTSTSELPAIDFSLVKAPNQDVLDATHFCGDVRSRQAGDLCDRRSVQLFEIQQHDLPIEWLQLSDQVMHLFERSMSIEHVLFVSNLDHRFNAFVERDERRCVGLRSQHFRRNGVVSNAVDPRPNRAPPVESGKASPQRDVDLLQQVATSLLVAFVRPGKPFERRAELCGCLRIPLLLTTRQARLLYFR